MKLFTAMYEKTLAWSQHRHATRYLAGMSFAESSFFPIPPDVMLAPMCLANNKKAVFYATITTIFSVLGGIFGYFLGYAAFELVEPMVREAGLGEHYDLAVSWFERWGVWIVFIAGFSPIPYKAFTIAAGAAGMALIPFILASIIGRGARFYAVALLIRWGGPRMEGLIHRYVEYLGWLLVVLIVVAILIM